MGYVYIYMFHNIMKYPHIKLKWVKTYPRLYAHLNMQCVNIHPQPHEAGALRAQAFLTQLEALGFELTRRRPRLEIDGSRGRHPRGSIR